MYFYHHYIGFLPIFDDKLYIMQFSEGIKSYAGQPITRQGLMDLLRTYKRPYDKISELVKEKTLIQVKRGIFVPGPRLSIQAPENMLLANHLWGPSYVSSDTALSFWGMIPERVYEICSMTTNIAKLYNTPVGRFTYIRLPLPYYSYGIQRIELAPGQMTLLAGKEKALCDKIVTTAALKLRSIKQTKQFLYEDLRISRETLSTLDTNKINDYLNESPKQDSLQVLVKTLNSL